MHNKESKLFFTVFFILGLFPLLPFHFKPIGVGISLILGLFIILKEKKMKFSIMYLNTVAIFLAYLISYFFSDDKAYALKYIETSLPLILFPIFFLFVSNIKFTKETLDKIEIFFYKIFYISSILYSIFIFIYIYSLGFFSEKVTYDYTLSYIRNMFWGFNENLIYISISLMFSLFFSLKLFKTYSKYKLIIMFGDVIILLTLVYISRKGVLIAGIISFIYILYKEIKSLKIKIHILLFAMISIVFMYMLFPGSSKRIKEVFQVETYTKPVDLKNSTSIRIQVYKCTFENIKKVGLFGYGIGDVKDKMYSCYQQNAQKIASQKLNTHNVFLNVLLGQGYIGFIVFLIILFNLFKFSLQNKDTIFTAILLFYTIEFLTENVLDRQNGVILFSLLINFKIFINLSHQKSLNEH